MKDVQMSRNSRGGDIQKVGVKDIEYPIVVLDKANGTQHTVGKFNMYVDLPYRFKGTHMSRFIEILNEYHHEISIKKFPEITEKMCQRLKARSAHLEVSFPYFIEKRAPVSQQCSLMNYLCHFCGNLSSHSGSKKNDFYIGVQVPVNSLCPCSKEISSKGAHNQRSMVTVNFRFRRMVWIEDIIALVEASSSAEVFSLLKRSDEKYLTEQAYDNPMFVEDVVREVAKKLNSDPNITWFSVESENFESIHNHNAYAYIEKGQIKTID